MSDCKREQRVSSYTEEIREQTFQLLSEAYLRMIRKPRRNQWSGRQHHLQNQTTARMCLSNLKAILVIFFDIHGIVMAEWVPNGQVVNQHH
jgi:hypothetical protein